MMTIVLSGPKVASQQALTALTAAGYQPQAGHDHGLPTTTNGKKPRQAVSFITLTGAEVDHAVECVRPLGFVLRMHHEAPPPATPSAEQVLAEQIAELRIEVDGLRRRLS